MRVVSPLLKSVVYPALAAAGYFRQTALPGLAVLTYHGVFPNGYKLIDAAFDGNRITAEAFRDQLRLVKKRYAVISPLDMQAWCRGEHKLPARAVLLTCDDGSLNNLTEMLPILQDEGLKCLFFVTGKSLGEHRTILWYEELFLMFLRAPLGSFQISAAGVELSGMLTESQRRVLWWNSVQQLSRVDAESRECFIQAAHTHFGLQRALDYYLAKYPLAAKHFGLMTRSEVLQLAAGGMTIGAHSLTHPVLSQLPHDLAWSEIADSAARLENLLGRRVWAFAYPFGDAASLSPEVIAMAKQAGFDAAFVNMGGGLGAELPLYSIPRVHVTSEMTLAEFEAHSSGFYQSLQRRFGQTSFSRASIVGTAQGSVLIQNK